jgi:hypothetical protein
MAWRPHVPEVWPHGQRIILIVFLAAMVIYLTLRLHRDREIVPAVLPEQGPGAGELVDQFDLNTVDAATLSAIPQLGEKKARDIVAYRERFMSAHPRQRAFERLQDLYRIKGIGAATLGQLRPYVFITTRPATQP